MKRILSIFVILFLVLPIFAFSGGPYMNYDLINDGTYFAKAIYGDTSLKTQNEISDNIRVHEFELGANLIFANDKTNGFDFGLRFKPHIGLSFLENQNQVGVQYTYYNGWAFSTYPKNMFGCNIGIEIGPDFSWHFNNTSFGFYPYVGTSFEAGYVDFGADFCAKYSTISDKSIQVNYVKFKGTLGIAPYVKLKKFMVSSPFGISFNSGINTLTTNINNKIINDSCDFTYIDAFFKIEIGFLF